MNLPNKLSFMRVLLVPVLVIVYYINVDLSLMFLAPIFVIASLTDFLDGYIARKYNLVTTFGKFIDPLADKLIVMTALLLLNDAGHVPMWITIIIMSREFIVTGIRLITVGEGKVIAASNLGKFKTASTMVALILLLMYPYAIIFADIGLYVLYIGLAFTVISLVDYYLKNKEIILKSI